MNGYHAGANSSRQHLGRCQTGDNYSQLEGYREGNLCCVCIPGRQIVYNFFVTGV